jgi:arylsulfatase A-like enzyme
LFLFADDLRPDAIGAYGNSYIQTPAIDGLVNRGFSFRRNYCFGSNGGAVCEPSRAMLNSGRSLWRVSGDLSGVKTLPEVLRHRGYVTFGTGKWHNKEPAFLRSFERGKSVMFGGMSNHLRVPIKDVADGKSIDRGISEKFSSELFADAAIDFLANYKDEKPFYAYVSFSAPHDPRQPPEKYRKMYYDARPPLPKNFLPQHPFHNGWMTGRDEALTGWPRQKSVVSDQLAEYYGMITHMDVHIGRILKILEVTGHARNTIVIFSADHGLAVGSHGLLGKQNLYEHSMGCPLVFAGDGIPAGKSSNALTYLFDIFPTVCELTGAPVPGGVEGKSLAPIWAGRSTSVRDTLFTTYEDLMRSVRDERWKLIRYPQLNHTQLFDLQSDPDELHNLAANPEQVERVKALTVELQAWQKKVGDVQPLSVKNPRPMEYDFSERQRKPDRHQPQWVREKYFGK